MNHVYPSIGRVSALAEICFNLLANSEFALADSARAEARSAVYRARALMNVAAALCGTSVPQNQAAASPRRVTRIDGEPDVHQYVPAIHEYVGDGDPEPGDCPEPSDLDLEDMGLNLNDLNVKDLDLEAAFQSVFGNWLATPAPRSDKAGCTQTSCEASSGSERRASEHRASERCGPTSVQALNRAAPVHSSARVGSPPVPRMPLRPTRAQPSQQAHTGSRPAHCAAELDGIAAAARSGNWKALVEQLSVAERVALTAALVGPIG